MKKIIIIIVIIITLSLGIYLYINNSQKTEGFVVDLSKIKFITDYNIFGDYNRTTKENLSDKNIQFEQKNITVQYKYSIGDTDVYISKDNDEYMFQNEELQGFLTSLKNASSKSNKTEKLDMNSARKVAEDFLKESVGNFEKYEYQSKYEYYKDSYYGQPYGSYSFSYIYKVNDYDTMDFINISINDVGEVLSYSAPHYGQFDKYKNIKFDAKKIETALLEADKNKLNNDLLNLVITDRFLRLLDGKLVLYLFITDVNEYVGHTVEEYLYYELE